MKLTETTIETLKNFAQINTALVIKAGKKQKTMADDKSILAEAVIEDDIPVEARIYNLPEFLGLLNMMGNPDIDFDTATATLSDGEMSLIYRYSPPNLIAEPPSDTIEIDDPDAKFTLLEKQLQKLLKVASALSLPNLVVEGGPKGIVVRIDDKENDSSHNGSIQLSKEATKEFTATWQTENLKIVPGNYNVLLSLDGVSIFENENQTRKYFIPLQV